MINTRRLLIRPYRLSDAKAFFALLETNRPRLQDYFFHLVNTTRSEDDTRIYLMRKQRDWERSTGFACGIFLQDTEQIVGHVSVRDNDWRIPKGEMAYFIFEPYTGQGFSGEALAAFRNWCFTEQNYNRLFLKIALDNEASIRTAEACGFRKEGVLKKDYRRGEKELIDIGIWGYTEDSV